MIPDQSGYEIRCEWGEHGVAALAPVCDAIIIVDVLSFSTAVTIAVARGATVFPHRWRDDTAAAFARSLNAELAGPRGRAAYSLAPHALRSIPAGTRLVLPSPNGATLALAAGTTPLFAGSLRNARAVALAARRCGPTVGVVPAGERWPHRGALRPALEDLLGAGAILQHFDGTPSPEARAAVAALREMGEDLMGVLAGCASGRELRGRGFAEDVALAAELDVEACAPRLSEGAFRPET